MTHATHVNGWFPAVYMSCVSQNFRLFHVSNLAVRNFRIFLLMYPGSVTLPALARASAKFTTSHLVDSGTCWFSRPTTPICLIGYARLWEVGGRGAVAVTQLRSARRVKLLTRACQVSQGGHGDDAVQRAPPPPRSRRTRPPPPLRRWRGGAARRGCDRGTLGSLRRPLIPACRPHPM